LWTGFSFRLRVKRGRKTENVFVVPPGWANLRPGPVVTQQICCLFTSSFLPEDGSRTQLSKRCCYSFINEAIHKTQKNNSAYYNAPSSQTFKLLLRFIYIWTYENLFAISPLLISSYSSLLTHNLASLRVWKVKSYRSIKRSDCEADHSLPSSAEVKNAWSSACACPLRHNRTCCSVTGTALPFLAFSLVSCSADVLFRKTVIPISKNC
jgi:hypothetical protein